MSATGINTIVLNKILNYAFDNKINNTTESEESEEFNKSEESNEYEEFNKFFNDTFNSVVPKEFDNILEDLRVLEKKIENIEFTKCDELRGKIIKSIEFYRKIIESYSGEKDNFVDNFKSTMSSIINDLNNIVKINELKSYDKDISDIKKTINVDMENTDELKKSMILKCNLALAISTRVLNIKYNSDIGIKNICKMISQIISNTIEESIHNIKKHYTGKTINDLNFNENIKTFYSLVIESFKKQEDFDNELLLYALNHLNRMINKYNSLLIIENNKPMIEFNLRIGKDEFIVQQTDDITVSDGSYISHSKKVFKKLDDFWFELFNMEKNMKHFDAIILINMLAFTKIKEIHNIIEKLSKYYIMDFQHYNNDNIIPINEELHNFLSMNFDFSIPEN